MTIESTRLSRFFYKIKNENIGCNNIIKWEIIQHTSQKRPSSICFSCNLERLETAVKENN